MALFAQEIVLILFGAKWLPAAPLFIAFGLAGIVRTLSAPFPQLIRGLGKPQIWLIWLLVFTSLLNVSLICSLSFQASPSNAAWSRTLVKFLVEIPLLYWLARYLGLQFQPILYFAGSLLCWLAPVALCTWLVGNIPGSWLWILTAKTSVFLLGVGWLALKSPAYDVFINWIKKP
jgi:O-antigen/teichoic acid export membrane protein